MGEQNKVYSADSSSWDSVGSCVVKSYQSANDLDADGKVGPATRAKINANCGG